MSGVAAVVAAHAAPAPASAAPASGSAHARSHEPCAHAA